MAHAGLVKSQPTRIDWTEARLLKIMKVLVDEQAFSPLRKARAVKKLKKMCTRGQLDPNTFDSEWAYRTCAAGLMVHDYHWWGWEWRSEWVARVTTKPWAYPQWTGQKCRVLVVAEQGFGDEIVFSSCYHELAEDVEEAWIECDPRLIPIFERSFPDNLHFVNRYLHPTKPIVPKSSDYPELHADWPIEAFIPAGNVPKLYRHCVADFPSTRLGFLEPDREAVGKWAGWLGADRLGVSWTGRQGDIPRPESGVSLQYGVTEHGSLTVPPIELKRDVDEVFALIYALGQVYRPSVYTTTNAVAHMAGALGVPTDVIKPPPIYATEEDMFNNRVQPWWPLDYTDWYPSIKIYRSHRVWTAASSFR